MLIGHPAPGQKPTAPPSSSVITNGTTPASATSTRSAATTSGGPYAARSATSGRTPNQVRRLR